MQKTILVLFLCTLSLFFPSSLKSDEPKDDTKTETTTTPPVETPTETPATPATTTASPLDVSYESTLLKMLLTLGGLLSLVFITIWGLKKLKQGRLGGFGSQKKIVILEKKPLSPKTLLYLIELDGKKILLSESQVEVKMLVLPQEQEAYE